MARTKPSLSGPVSGFWPKTRNPGLHSPTRDPTTDVTSSSPPHHLSPSPPPVSDFWPQTRNPGLRSPTRDPTADVTSLLPPHHPSALSPAAISYGVPETELQQLSFAFLAQTPPRASCFQPNGHTTTTTITTPFHHPSASSPAAVSHGTPETELQQLGFAFLAQTPSPSLVFPTEWPHHHHHNNNNNNTIP
ncbi:hypothetical protein PILCRDRAFT_279 [Piloderma croceum F 1598]|uniref:Uncharacterized protein n=1 Tax=Piloderma croceum (strain F 1598) TaxID=765440 RepID=A0A0C3CRA0_PILCF|nr:hypothetical protein PILCRDRAFT_279 [Piloderma croceum F 1598]